MSMVGAGDFSKTEGVSPYGSEDPGQRWLWLDHTEDNNDKNQ